MRDARLRVLCTLLLSAGAFLSVPGALAAFAWWLLLTPRWRGIRLRPLLWLLAMAAGAALLSELGGGDGLSYLLRMSAILLIAAWAFGQRREGELLDVSVWLLGPGIGFDIGLAAEMGMQNLGHIQRDIQQARQAMEVKGMRLSASSLLPLASGVLVSQLRRADGMARLLTVRGYMGGGTVDPSFERGRWELLSALCAALVLLAGLLPYY